MERTTKQLKSRVFRYGDGVTELRRHAVYENGVRIGTVYENRALHCETPIIYFDPFRGTGGSAGDGKIITRDFIIQRRYSLAEAIALI